MAISRENYQVNTTDPQGMLLRINSILSSISDRLDKLEGFRGELETASGTFSGDVKTKGSVLVVDDDITLHSMENV